VKREIPVEYNPELDLYTRTYYSLLRSSGEVEVRAFEEGHAFSASALHEGALSPRPDVAAFAYAAARLPDCIMATERIVLAQSHELFEASSFNVRSWQVVKTRGRRRPLRFSPNGSKAGDPRGVLAVFIASASDIDDLVPIVTAYQIEWNKMHLRLAGLGPKEVPSNKRLSELLDVSAEDLERLIGALGGPEALGPCLREIAKRPSKLRLRMLAPSYSQYQRAAQRWWSGIEPTYLRTVKPRRPPVYFVSSNTHAVANLLGGYAMTHGKEISDWVKKTNPEGLGEVLRRAESTSDPSSLLPIIYYAVRGYLHSKKGRIDTVRAYEKNVGITHLSEPGHIDVDAQLIELGKLDYQKMDPRLSMAQTSRLRKSRAIILNIDYPLGMAAYHLLSRLSQGVGEIRGIYIMGKAATLNGRVGDVSISGTVFDEHSRNTFLFRNCFGAADISPWLKHGSVFDNQRALTVRSAFLQNKEYMSGFYRAGYSVMEMEAGPFLSSIYELVNPTRVPHGEIVHLSAQTPFDVGLVHYASDTPYSRRQSLLSKSLSFFGVDSTYACAIAIVRRILATELQHLSTDG
jgi:hypothetical protein